MTKSRVSLCESRLKTKDYADNVRKNIVPKIDQEKRNFFKTINTKKEKDVYEKAQIEKELYQKRVEKGKENMEFLRQLKKKAKKT